MLWWGVREKLVVSVCPFYNYAKPTAHQTYRLCGSCNYRARGGKMHWATFGPRVIKYRWLEVWGVLQRLARFLLLSRELEPGVWDSPIDR